MPPTLTKTVAVSCSAANEGEYVKITNLTSGGSFLVALDANKEVVVSSETKNLSWADGDSIQAEIVGRVKGLASGTISKGRVSLSITAAADTTTPGVDL